MTETTDTTPDGPAAASPSDEAGEPQAPDQDHIQKEQTDLLGLIQRELEGQDWGVEVSDVGNHGMPTVLELIAPSSGQLYTLTMGPHL